jgi:hypothetical protein
LEKGGSSLVAVCPWDEDSLLSAPQTKRKLSAPSSAESELVGADDFMLATCWTRRFAQAQGHKIEHSTSFQDNKSSALLKKNGEASSSERTKRVNACHFQQGARLETALPSLSKASAQEIQGLHCGSGAGQRSGTQKSLSRLAMRLGDLKGRQLFVDHNERRRASALGFDDSWMQIICHAEDALRKEARSALLLGDSAKLGNERALFCPRTFKLTSLLLMIWQTTAPKS